MALTRAAFFIGRVTDRVGRELAGIGIAARVVTTPIRSTAVTVFILLHNAVTTLTACDGVYVPIARQAIRLHTLSADSRTDVTNAAGRELSDTVSRRRVHDKVSAGITRGRAKGTALLFSSGAVCTRRRSAVVYGPKRVPSLMGNNLPFCRRPHYNVRRSDSLVLPVGSGRLRTFDTDLAKPGQANSRVGITGTEECPVGIRVVVLTPPSGEEVEAISNGDAAGAGDIPRSRGRSRCRARSFADGEILDAQRDVERTLVDLRGRVYLIDDVLAHRFGGVELSRIRAICGDADQGNFPSRRTPRCRTDSRAEIHASAISSRCAIDLPSPETARGHRPPEPVRLAPRIERPVDRMVVVPVEQQLVRCT